MLLRSAARLLRGRRRPCAGALASGELYVGVPRSGDYAGLPGYVEVYINDDHPVFFGRILGQESAFVSTYAVAANGATGVGNVNGNSLVAFDPASCGAGQINGNGQVNITNLGDPGEPGGFVYVNSLCGIDPPGGSADDTCNNSGTGGFTMNGNPSSSDDRAPLRPRDMRHEPGSMGRATRPRVRRRSRTGSSAWWNPASRASRSGAGRHAPRAAPCSPPARAAASLHELRRR